MKRKQTMKKNKRSGKRKNHDFALNLTTAVIGAGIERVATHVSNELDLGRVENKLNSIQSMLGDVDKKTGLVEKEMQQIREDLNTLTDEFRKMVEDQKRAASLQKAITELVRVRQEIGQKYSNYSVTRETMLGVLQATDAALVKKTTIARVSEELMLSTPQYWLAPCLVAVSAWISNDRDLAERAIAEAMKRDEEKTSLCLALICRRNGRIQTGYEWLSIYFSKQNASDITEEAFTYIDAYVNGVFGPDEQHMCQGYVAKWIDDIRGNKSNFEASQEQKWKEYCEKFKIDARKLFPDLADISPEFKQINAFIGSINSYGAIRDNFKEITDAFVDQETMKKTIDSELIHLISNYDKSEIEIRREEEYLSLVKFYEGDEEKAKKEMLVREAKRQQHKLDFIEQMSQEITDDRDTSPSKRRTAVAFLSGYINRGYTKYIDGAKESFPTAITLNIDQWKGKSADGSEYNALVSDYEKKMNEAKNDAIHRAVSIKPKTYAVFAVVLLVLCAITIVLNPNQWYMGAILGAVGILMFGIRGNMVKNTEKRIAKINEEFNLRISEGKNKLSTSLEQWRSARNIITQYESEGEHKVA